MPSTFGHHFDTPLFKGETSFSTGLFIDGKFVDGVENTEIEIINPTNGRTITRVSAGTSRDVDLAVEAAQRAFTTTWGPNVSSAKRGALLNTLAALIEKHHDELAAIEALDNGKTFLFARHIDVQFAIDVFKHYAGWADKITGQTIETDAKKLAYTRHEPIGVVGQIIPWNFPLVMLAWKLGPALCTGNSVVLKPSELTPLTALRVCQLIVEAGFPPGSVNIITGYGNTVGCAISSHMKIDKVAFTGSDLIGRKVMEAAANSNLKNVTLELGGKSPAIVFDDADLEQAINWTSRGVFGNQGQTCFACTRIFVQEGIYDTFLAAFTKKAQGIKMGDPFGDGIDQGPQVSQAQFNRVMAYIESGREQGATIHLGGDRFGEEGYFINPTIFTDVKPSMRIVREEIFGPVGVIIKFEDEKDVLRQANDTLYGLAASVFTKDITRGIETAHQLQAGTVWVNSANMLHPNIPFGGYKQSGIGKELGEYALHNYTNVKAVHINLKHRLP